MSWDAYFAVVETGVFVLLVIWFIIDMRDRRRERREKLNKS